MFQLILQYIRQSLSSHVLSLSNVSKNLIIGSLYCIPSSVVYYGAITEGLVSIIKLINCWPGLQQVADQVRMTAERRRNGSSSSSSSGSTAVGSTATATTTTTTAGPLAVQVLAACVRVLSMLELFVERFTLDVVGLGLSNNRQQPEAIDAGTLGAAGESARRAHATVIMVMESLKATCRLLILFQPWTLERPGAHSSTSEERAGEGDGLMLLNWGNSVQSSSDTTGRHVSRLSGYKTFHHYHCQQQQQQQQCQQYQDRCARTHFAYTPNNCWKSALDAGSSRSARSPDIYIGRRSGLQLRSPIPISSNKITTNTNINTLNMSVQSAHQQYQDQSRRQSQYQQPSQSQSQSQSPSPETTTATSTGVNEQEHQHHQNYSMFREQQQQQQEQEPEQCQEEEEEEDEEEEDEFRDILVNPPPLRPRPNTNTNNNNNSNSSMRSVDAAGGYPRPGTIGVVGMQQHQHQEQEYRRHTRPLSLLQSLSLPQLSTSATAQLQMQASPEQLFLLAEVLYVLRPVVYAACLRYFCCGGSSSASSSGSAGGVDDNEGKRNSESNSNTNSSSSTRATAAGSTAATATATATTAWTALTSTSRTQVALLLCVLVEFVLEGMSIRLTEHALTLMRVREQQRGKATGETTTATTTTTTTTNANANADGGSEEEDEEQTTATTTAATATTTATATATADGQNCSAFPSALSDHIRGGGSSSYSRGRVGDFGGGRQHQNVDYRGRPFPIFTNINTNTNTNSHRFAFSPGAGAPLPLPLHEMDIELRRRKLMMLWYLVKAPIFNTATAPLLVLINRYLRYLPVINQLPSALLNTLTWAHQFYFMTSHS